MNRHTLALLLVLPLATGACGLLKKKGAADDAGADEAAAPQASASAAPEPTESPDAAAPAAEELKLSGACVDTKADAQKHADKDLSTGVGLSVESVDLDGDGKNDRVYTAQVQGLNSGWLYVTRGTCGYYVGAFPLHDEHKLLGAKSHGLRTYDIHDTDHGCAGQCECPSHSTPFVFNGTKYVAGKMKDLPSKCDAGAKKVLPKCAVGQSLFAEDDSSPVFCSKVCSADAECKPAKCDTNGFTVDDKSGVVFVGAGRSIMVCGKGAGPAPAPSAAGAGTVVPLPPGNPGIIPNPKLLECPPGYRKLMGTKTCNRSCATEKCPAGTTCQQPMAYCM